MENEIPLPGKYFGFELGSDRKLARWDRIVEYFNILDNNSDCIKVVELGKSSLGNPFILAIISSPKNLSRMAELKEISRRLADPRGLSKDEIDDLVRRGKPIVVFTNSVHANEVGGTQLSSELAYELVTSKLPDVKTILEDVVLLLFPCNNPDGQLMVVDYYNKWVGTEFEGGKLPTLHHKYCGGENNRDCFMMSHVETKLFSQVVYKEWYPHAHIDFHHMRHYVARYWVPPYYEPIDTNLDPMLYWEHQLYGAHMAVKLEQAGKVGVINGVDFSLWWPASYSGATNWHNICGMLTECAAVTVASPIYIHPNQLKPMFRGMYNYEAQHNFPSPWPGGWWRLRDILDYQKISAIATLEVAAKWKETILRNKYLKARRNVERGEDELPYAFIVPDDQHDLITAYKMLETLEMAGVEIHKAKEEFQVGGAIYPKGTRVIFLAQPHRAYIKTLLECINYPDNEWTRKRDGSPLQPYDLATYNLAEFMGVKIISVDEKITGDFEKVPKVEYPKGQVLGESKYGYITGCNINTSYTAVVRLLEKGYTVYRIDEAFQAYGGILPAGSFLIMADREDVYEYLTKLGTDCHVNFHPVEGDLAVKKHKLKTPRVAVYKRYYGGNRDEGAIRWILDNFEFPYVSVWDKEIKKGNMKDIYDILIIPDDHKSLITGEGVEKGLKESAPEHPVPHFPQEYLTGIGREGVKELKTFVEDGGILLCLNGATQFAIEEFSLPIMNILESKPEDFFCAPSNLRVDIDNANPLAYGMPKEGTVLFGRVRGKENSPVFEVAEGDRNELYQPIVTYKSKNILQSGWLKGEKYLSRKVTMLEVTQGKGKIVLIGFASQFRTWTYGTFKYLFNSIMTSAQTD